MSKATWAHRYPLAFQNAASETAPAYGVLQVLAAPSVGDTRIYAVVKPTGATAAVYFINAPEAVAAGGYGAASDQIVDAMISGTPGINQEVGPVSNSWALSPNGKGFTYLGGLVNGIGTVKPKAGTSAGDDFPLVRILNTSGTNKPYGTICGIGDPLNPPPANVDRILAFNSAAPVTNRPFVVLLDDVPPLGSCDAAPVGIVSCKINYKDTSHSFADVVSNDYDKLVSVAHGQARIMWREREFVSGSGTLGVQWAQIRFETVPPKGDIRGITYGNITAATGNAGGPITPGFGPVLIYAPPASGPLGFPVGTQWTTTTPASPVTAENWMHAPVDPFKPVLLDFSRFAPDGTKIYTIKAEGCKDVPQ